MALFSDSNFFYFMPMQGIIDQSRKMAKHTEKKKQVTKPLKKVKKQKETTSNLGDQVEAEN